MGNKGKQEGEQEGVQWETKGGKTLGKADTPSNQGKKRRDTMGDKGENKTLGKADTPSLRKTKRATMRDKGGQDLQES